MSAPPDLQLAQARRLAMDEVGWPYASDFAFSLGWVVAGTFGAIVPMFAMRVLGGVRGAWLAVAFLILAGSLVITRAVVRFARRRAVAEAEQAGLPIWDADWTGPRDVVESNWFATRLRRHAFGAYMALGQVTLLGSMTLARLHPLAALLLVGAFAVLVITLVSWRAFRGDVQVKFDRFPLLPGQRSTFWIAMTEGSPRLEGMEVLLRCVSYRRSKQGATLWAKAWIAPWGGDAGPDEFVPVTFDLPPDALGTALRAKRPVRWELLVAGRTRWGKVMERFVVPVYAPAPEPGAS